MFGRQLSGSISVSFCISADNVSLAATKFGWQAMEVLCMKHAFNTNIEDNLLCNGKGREGWLTNNRDV